jgi:signal transduction histidine kinase
MAFASVTILLPSVMKIASLAILLAVPCTYAAVPLVEPIKPQLTLRMGIVKPADGPRLRIRVEDDGEGIAPENLSRLFAHGFTTRKSGHGFGLHSCALAAKEMAGTITAHSDGIGKGATFTLELPITPV